MSREPDEGGANGATHRDDGGRRRFRWVMLLGLLAGAALLLLGWNRVAASPKLCGSCHSMTAAVASASRSVHADVPCLACHTRSGLAGSLRYLPSFAREGVATLTGWSVAHGILDAKACDSCHSDLRTSPSLKKAHAEGSTDCSSCHGEVAHPPLTLVAARPTPSPSGQPHPSGYTQTHGEDAVSDPASCNSCHQPRFCESCHFKSTFPHPDDWISKHGPAEEANGPDACSLCHPSTFCVGCHGTEIPHPSTWLSEHWRTLQETSVTPCFVCHTRSDCTTCHAEHQVHRDQSLYVRGPA